MVDSVVEPMSTEESYPREIREAWAMWILVESLGFKTEEIFFTVSDDEKQCGVTLRAQDKALTLVIGAWSLSSREAERLWNRICEDMEQLSEAEMFANWKRSRACAKRESVLRSLRAHGLLFPVEAN